MKTILAAQLESMKTKILLLFSFLALLTSAPASIAADAMAVPTWHAQTLGQAITNMLIFAGAGMVAAIAGFKLSLTPTLTPHHNRFLTLTLHRNHPDPNPNLQASALLP